MTVPETPQLSIVVIRRHAEDLRDVCAALRAQRGGPRWELIVVTDGPWDRAESGDIEARVVTVAADATPGTALNRGIAQARGEFVVLLNAGSLPVGSGFLAAAAEPFADPGMAAARCLMAFDKRQLTAWYRGDDVQYRTPQEQAACEAESEWDKRYPSEACCVLRRSVWQQFAFDEQLEAVTDKLWASQVLAAGWKIRSCAEAVWLPLHKLDGASDRTKRYREQLGHYRITGRPSLGWRSFLVLAPRTVLAAPIVALRQTWQRLAWYTLLVTIPLRARFTPRSNARISSNKPVRTFTTQAA